MPRAVKAEKRASKWPARAALFGVTLVAYVNSFWIGLAQDSKVILAQDTRLTAVTGDNLALIFTKNYWWPLGGDGLYRPVTTLSLLFNYAVLGNGRDAAGYHVVNFLVHAINVWLLYELALAIFRRAGPAFFAAAIWAVHPIGAEAVTSIAGRADLLAAMSVLGGLLLYVRGRSRWTPAVLFVIATLGVFAKENAAVLIGLMLLWDLSFRSKPRWREYAAVAASLVVLAVVRSVVLGNLAPYSPIYVDNSLRLAGFWTARWTAIGIVGSDLKLLLFPLTLVCDHSFAAIPLASFSDAAAWISLLAVIAILAYAVMRRRQDPVAFWAAGFFAITLLPTSNLLFLIGAAFAERFLYLPAVAFAVMAAALIYRLKNERVAKGLLIALLAVYAVRTVARNPAWDSDLTLASADLPNSPRSFRLHYMLARAFFEQDALGNIDRAIAEQEAVCLILAPLPPFRSISFPPTDLGRYYAVKATLVAPGQQIEWLEKSRATLLKAREISRALEAEYDNVQRAQGPLRARAGDQQLYLYLAETEIKLGNYADAVESLRYAQGLNPRTLELYDGLGVAYTKIGNPAMAVVSLEEKGLTDNFQAATMRSIRELYKQAPDRECAFIQRGAGFQLNVQGCPQVKGDLCTAYSELAQAYRDARVPQGAHWAAAEGRERYGCAVR